MCFVAGRNLNNCNHQPHDSIIYNFGKTVLDTRLNNTFRDLHAFSCISNVAYRTTGKLSPEMYNEMMISILYRLTNLSFEDNNLQETIRIGLLVFSTTLFMLRHFMEQPYDHLLNLFDNVLSSIREARDARLPESIEFWLVIFSHVVSVSEYPSTDWRSLWLDETILNMGINSWAQACEVLRTVMWVDFIHTRPGRQAFETAMVRLRRN